MTQPKKKARGIIVEKSIEESIDELLSNTNYDESKVPSYELPDALTMRDGRAVTDVEMWRTQRRPELLELFADQMYGRTPQHKLPLFVENQREDRNALGGMATRREVTLRFDEERGPSVEVITYLPNTINGAPAAQPIPAFLGLNFTGNHSIHADEGISLSVANSDIARGEKAERWPVELILSRGYACVTAFYGDIDPDNVDDLTDGPHPLFYAEGQTHPAPDEWKAIGAWSWGLSRILDYLETESDIDAAKVAVHGHSRLGKAALWAGAQDERFAIVISNNSGCCGTCLSRRIYGETIEVINRLRPYWMCDNFKKFNRRENELPFDQHELMALIAPRPLYVASATEDRWADPRGEFLGALGAEAVYELHGKTGLGTEEMPAPERPVGDSIGYHLRIGPHNVLEYDWQQFLNFADRHLAR